MMGRTFLSIVLAGALLAGPAAAADCGMSLAFKQPDEGGAKLRSVWADPGAKGLLFAEGLHVNTDGTRRSYRVDDFWGETDAVNNLCNAMSDACDGLSQEGLKARRIATQNARAAGWPAAQLAATRIAPSIIPFRNGKPCPELPGGFLVSATALHKPPPADACDVATYADSMSAPALVLPKRAASGTLTPFEMRNAKVGDLAVVMSGDGARIAYAVVGDTGPSRELGEGSIALARILLGKDHDPVNYREVRGKPPFVGQGWDVPRSFVLILPGTRNATSPYITRDRIEAEAKAAFATWGGAERLNACRTAYVP
jgi:hypothetical protein